jgi:dipeptidyl aminopeptidase/acylaminoacyl peptidase
MSNACAQIGRQDVDDVMRAAAECVASFPHIDPNSMIACGGSHGGFLSLHLVGQVAALHASMSPVVSAHKSLLTKCLSSSYGHCRLLG